MPSMFSRRRNSASQVNYAPPSSSAAAIAASSAFLKSSPSTTSLSSAAAAAALRSHTTSPESIANLQTKRMIRRGSVSSVGSGSIMGGTPSRAGLARRDSSGSMTERTFRSPSPGGRAPSRTSHHVPAAVDAPPVPPVKVVKARRSASVEPPMQRVTSPTPPRGARGVSVDRTGFSDRNRRVSSLPKLAELDRESSQRSVNFSRPMASPPSSPPTSPTGPGAGGSWFGPPVQSNGSPRGATAIKPQSKNGTLSSGEVSGIQTNIQSAADKPVMKKKKKVTTAPQQGGHLAAGTMSSGPQGTAVDSRPTSPVSKPQQMSPPPSQAPTPMKKRVKKQTNDSATADMTPPPKNPARTSTSNTRVPNSLHKQPSVVREDPEAEETAERYQNANPKRSSSMVQTSEGPAILWTPRSASLEVPEAHAKSAHWSTSVVDANGVRHNPPPRSVSPAKSALKHSPSSSLRGTSPVPQFNYPRRPPSDTSDTMSVTSQDGVKAGNKKKSARVSFDNDAVVVNKEPQKQETANTLRRPLSPSGALDDDMDEMMRPRPALPSFGSVRNSASPGRPAKAEKATDPLPANGAASSDHAIGAAISTDHARKANAAKNVVEPIPPEVTSVEGSGYQSDGSHYTDDEVEGPRDSAALVTSEKSIPTDSIVPDIAVLPATPGIEDENAKDPLQSPSSQKSYVMPGSWDEVEDQDEDYEEAKDTLPPLAGEEDRYERPSPRLEAIEESEDDSDAFSDAAEEPSEMEGGFASLAAIVHSPLTPVVRTTTRTVPDSPTRNAVEQSPTSDDSEEGPGDWTEATAYWSSLSRKHKQQLEQQAQVQTSPKVVEEPKKTKKPKTVTLAPAPTPTPAPAPKAKIVSPKQSMPPAQRASLKAAENSGQPLKPAIRKSMRGSQDMSDQDTPSEPPTQMRKSMRGAEGAKPAGAMRSSMRGGQDARQRPSSLVQQGTAPQAKQGGRPASVGGQAASPAAAVAAARKPAVATAPAMTRVQSNDSDSDSSFKKKRRTSVSTMDSAGRYNMKRSMRAGSVDTPDRRALSPGPANSSSKWSIRSASPPGSNARNSMRQSMRRQSMDNTPTMRGQNSKARKRDESPSRFSISSFRSARPAETVRAPARPQSRTGGFRSRFNDSDDESVAPTPARAKKGGFASRFMDSDDEADSPTVPQRFMQNDLTPVRGIPRRTNDDDSTDLSDSEEESAARNSKANGKRTSKRSSKAPPIVPSQADIDAVMAQARRNVAAQTGNEDLAYAEPSTPKAGKKVTMRSEAETNGYTATPEEEPVSPGLNKRRGLLGSIFGGRKRSGSTATIPRLSTFETTPQPSEPASPLTPRGGRLQRKNTPQLIRQGSSASAMPAAPTTQAQALAMNQSVTTPGAMSQNSQNWPLPPPIPDSEPVEVRPSTSDGVVETKPAVNGIARPDIGRRTQSGMTTGTKAEVPVVYSERTGRKKKFSKLRKAFGLHD